MARLRLFAQIREIAGTREADVEGDTVSAVIAEAGRRFGPDFAAAAPRCAVWVNGAPAEPDTPVGAADEVAVLPPVSGGASGRAEPGRR